MLKEIYELFSCVKPIGDDDVRHIWIEAERGPLEAFGDYEEYKECGEVEEIVNMISGTDLIGIVPDTVVPRYCHSLFPKDDRIIDFMNLDNDESTQHAIIGKTYWYPLEKIEHNCKTI